MRILHISSARGFGGGERHLADLATALTRRGHDVFVALPRDSQLRPELTELPAGNLLALRMRNALDVGSAMELLRLLREHRIDILHAHVARDYPLAAIATKRNRDTKLIITRHVLFPLNGLHGLALSHVARVIAVSRAVERSLVAQKLFPLEKLIVIPNGIDFDRFQSALTSSGSESFRSKLDIPPGAILIGTVGDLKPQKGHEDFLRAAAVIARERAEVHFIVVGSDNAGNSDYLKRLNDLAADLALKNRVTFTGWVDDVASMLKALDVFVSASRTESFGLAIVEAMALGLPVVATATDGAKEILDHDSNGLLVPVADVEALISSTVRLIEDADERTRLGTRAQTIARDRFGLDKMVDETEKVYRESMEKAD